MTLRYARLGLGLATSLGVHPERLSAQHLSLSPAIGVSITKAADDCIYGTNVDERRGGEKKTQNDVHLSVGLGIPRGNR